MAGPVAALVRASALIVASAHVTGKVAAAQVVCLARPVARGDKSAGPPLASLADALMVTLLHFPTHMPAEPTKVEPIAITSNGSI